MTLQEADQKLSELFPRKYRSISYELTTHKDGTFTRCGVYMDSGAA